MKKCFLLLATLMLSVCVLSKSWSQSATKKKPSDLTISKALQECSKDTSRCKIALARVLRRNKTPTDVADYAAQLLNASSNIANKSQNLDSFLSLLLAYNQSIASSAFSPYYKVTLYQKALNTVSSFSNLPVNYEKHFYSEATETALHIIATTSSPDWNTKKKTLDKKTSNGSSSESDRHLNKDSSDQNVDKIASNMFKSLRDAPLGSKVIEKICLAMTGVSPVDGAFESQCTKVKSADVSGAYSSITHCTCNDKESTDGKDGTPIRAMAKVSCPGEPDYIKKQTCERLSGFSECIDNIPKCKDGVEIKVPSDAIEEVSSPHLFYSCDGFTCEDLTPTPTPTATPTPNCNCVEGKNEKGLRTATLTCQDPNTGKPKVQVRTESCDGGGKSQCYQDFPNCNGPRAFGTGGRENGPRNSLCINDKCDNHTCYSEGADSYGCVQCASGDLRASKLCPRCKGTVKQIPIDDCSPRFSDFEGAVYGTNKNRLCGTDYDEHDCRGDYALGIKGRCSMAGDPPMPQCEASCTGNTCDKDKPGTTCCEDYSKNPPKPQCTREVECRQVRNQLIRFGILDGSRCGAFIKLKDPHPIQTCEEYSKTIWSKPYPKKAYYSVVTKYACDENATLEHWYHQVGDPETIQRKCP